MNAIHVHSTAGGSAFCRAAAPPPDGIGRMLWFGMLAVILASTTGCADRPREAGLQRFVPDAADARGAMLAVLEEWKTEIPRNSHRKELPQVELVDNQRRPGRRIRDYKILGQTEFEGGRRLHVQVTWSDPEQIEKLRFVVVGIDPLWVFRQEDYDMISHWDHAMPPPGAPAAGEPAVNVPAATPGDLPSTSDKQESADGHE